MKKIKKKGISPLIATVLVIGFTVALAAVILTWGTSFTKNISKSTEETTAIQLACAQDVQFDVKSACWVGDALNAPVGLRFIVENNGNRDIINFTARFKFTETNIVAGQTRAGVNKFGLRTYTAMEAEPLGVDYALLEVPGLDTLGGLSYDDIREVTLLPVIVISGKEVTCGQSIDSYSPAVEGTPLNQCE